jgi:endonuclease/exonuclease/phosphatase family metal-dependent hydrolase
MIKFFRLSNLNFFKALAIFGTLISCGLEEKNPPDTKFDFDGTVASETHKFNVQNSTFDSGIDGQALIINPKMDKNTLELDEYSLDGSKDFSIQCWIKTTSNKPMVFLSKKAFNNKGIIAQKNAGWALYSSGGTFGWSIGSGDRRINYERDNGEILPVNDGNWHQITITFNKENSEFRLYYDGHNKAIYKVNFGFKNSLPLSIGSPKNTFNNNYAPDIENGLTLLQEFVDAFNAFGLEPIKDDEFLDLIVDSKDLFNKKLKAFIGRNVPNEEALTTLNDVKRELGMNPYTVSQNMKLTVLKPVSAIYKLQNGKVNINEAAGKSFTEREQLYASDFSIDQLSIWESTLNDKDVLYSYNNLKDAEPFKLANKLDNINIGVWNIWHGGIHWSLEKDGWDSRKRIADIIKEKNLDVVLMQETYSGGDFIAAELSYYFATTSDWDYKYQGANISVLSRYPINELKVSEETEFNNVAVKLTISETQEVWAMSNWYGMNNFSKVYDFNASRFENSDSIPIFFGGDFNAVPHTDGGESPASLKMQEEGFTDAYRDLHSDVDENPGYTHLENVRIDQLYYKGKGLKNTSTEVISSWPSGFPSDHFLIVSIFELKN